MDHAEIAKALGSETIKRTVKDSVFTHLFSDKKYLLQLYRVLHPDDVETREEDLDIITIENVLINGIYNDLGFKVKNRLIILVEAQATYSENILIRTLMYYAKTLSDYLDDKGIDLDLTVHMLYGGSDDILSQYVNFTKIYDQQRAVYGKREQAIKATINICKNKHYLKEYLQIKEREVYDIMYTLYDVERITRIHERALYNEVKAEVEKAFAKEKAAYAAREENYLSQIAELESRLAMQEGERRI